MGEPNFGVALNALTNFFTTQTNKKSSVNDLLRENQVLARFISSDTKGAGEDWSITAPWLAPRGIGVDRAGAQETARGNAGRPSAEKWKGEWCPKKASLFINEQTILAAAQSKGEAVDCFLQTQGELFNQVITELGERLEEDLWSTTGGALCTLVSCSSGVATLANKMLTMQIKPGDILEYSANDGSSTGHVTAGTYGYVIKVNENTGVVTLSQTDGGAAGQPAGWGTGAGYLFRKGQFGGGSAPVDQITGIRVYLPATDPTTSLLNVDRTKCIALWSGVRIISGEVADVNPLAIMRKLLTKFHVHGYRQPGRYGFFVHPEIWDSCANTLEAQGNRNIVGTDAKTGLSTISITGPFGNVPIFAAPRCPYNNGFLINAESFKFRSMGKWPQPAGTAFGARAQVAESSDDYEWRLMGFGALQCKYPGANATCYFPGSATYL